MSLVISLGLAVQRQTRAPATSPPTVAPVNTALPAITGTAQVGQTLTASAGAWTNSPNSFAYVWRRGGVAISGATASAYVPVLADVGTTLTVQVIASNVIGASAPATSAATAAVVAAVVAVPVNTTVPVITGTAQVGQVLTASTGTWTNSPTSFTYQWNRNGVPISGATGSTRVVDAGAVGAVNSVTVTATNAGGASAPVTSAATATIIAAVVAVPVNITLPAITGTAQVGQVLTASTGTWTNSPTSFTYQWNRNGVPISGATGSTRVVDAGAVGAVNSVTVTATNAGGASAPVTSAATATIIAAAAPVLFPFELLNEAGSATITAVPNLRISVDGGTSFFALASVPGHPGLTLARHADGDKLVIAGWAGGIMPAGLRVHYEQAIPGEPNSASRNTTTNLPALYFRRLSGPAPVNTSLPGMTVAATRFDAPVGVS